MRTAAPHLRHRAQSVSAHRGAAATLGRSRGEEVVAQSDTRHEVGAIVVARAIRQQARSLHQRRITADLVEGRREWLIARLISILVARLLPGQLLLLVLEHQLDHRAELLADQAGRGEVSWV